MLNEKKGMGRILLMDDEPIIRHTIGMLLQMLGYAVLSAKEGGEAIELFRKACEEGHPVNAAILDLVIDQGMGGRETAVEIRKLNPKVPILVVSGYSNDPVMAAPKDYLFTDSLPKPFRSAHLIAKLEYHLQRAGN
jgi:CheY-like chemotaxis protein